MKVFTKNQILNSKKYKDRYDILNSLLKDNKTYSIKDVDKILKDFMKGGVK